MNDCDHQHAIVVRGGSLCPEERVNDYEAAWCPMCGAFREDSAFAGEPEPWRPVGPESVEHDEDQSHPGWEQEEDPAA